MEEEVEVEKEDSPLFQAIIRKESAHNILAMIDRDPSSVRQRGTNGNYPLHQACLMNTCSSRVIIKILDLYPQAAQAKQLYGTYVDHYLLHIACHRLSDKVILKLLEVYPDAAKINNQEKNINYPLHIGCCCRRSDHVMIKLIEIFPEAVASKSVSRHDDMYPLHIACRAGYSLEVFQKLLKIDPKALHERASMFHWKSSIGYYPLDYAIQHNASIDIIKLFVTTDPTILQQTDDHGITPLHYACRNHVRLVECLLQYPDLPINARTHSGETPLHYTCSSDFGGLEAVVEMILEHPNIDVNAINLHGQSTLHMMMERQHFDVIDLLLHHPCIRIDQKDHNNQTPFDVINQQITNITNRRREEKSLHRLMEIRNFLHDFPIKRKWQSYNYFHQDIVDWSSPKKMKK